MCSSTGQCFAYIGPVPCNVQILNVRKAPAKVFGLVIIKIPNTNMIIPLLPSYYMPHKPKNTISQNSLKHYNEFVNVRTESLRWVKMTTDTGLKFKVETSANKRYQQLLELITIDILKREQQHPSVQDIINITMNPIIKSSLEKQPMSWEIIHCHLLHPYDSAIKAM